MSVVAIMPSGKIATFPTVYVARAILLKKFHHSIYENSEQIYKTMSHGQTLELIRKLAPELEVPVILRADHSAAAIRAFELMVERAEDIYHTDRRGRLVKVHHKETASDIDNDPFKLTAYWLLYKPGENPVMDAAFIKLAPQARACVQLLLKATEAEVQAGRDVVMSEATVFKYVMNDLNFVRTRQSKWRIFKYYRSSLIARNFLRMRG